MEIDYKLYRESYKHFSVSDKIEKNPFGSIEFDPKSIQDLSSLRKMLRKCWIDQ